MQGAIHLLFIDRTCGNVRMAVQLGHRGTEFRCQSALEFRR